MSKKKLNIFLFIFLVVLFFAIYITILGGEQAFESWLLVTILLSPALLMCLFIKSLLLRLFIGISFITQFLGVPWFVINKSRYNYTGWRAVKNFDFTLSEFFYVYINISAFLLMVVFFYCLVKIFFPLRPVKLRLFKGAYWSNASEIILRPQKKGSIFVFLMMFLILFLIPLNIWMFTNGIGMTGVRPLRLPFKLSGGLLYSTKYFIPIFLFWLYSKTTRGLFPTFLIMFYALVLGATQISKQSVGIALFPVVFFSIIERRKVLFVISGLWGFICIRVAVLMRYVVYAAVDNSGHYVTSFNDSFWSNFYRVLKYQIANFSLVDTFFMIVARVDSPQHIVLGSQSNIDKFGGLVVNLKRFIFTGWGKIDADAYHLEWIGITLTRKAAGGCYLSRASAFFNHSIYLGIFLAFLTAVYLFWGEFLIKSINRKYDVSYLYYSLSGVFVLILFVNVGTKVWWGYVFMLLILFLLPKIRMPFSTIK